MKNNISFKDITIVIVSYKSKKKVLNILKKTRNFCRFIIVENSNDITLKEIIEKNYRKNVKIILSKNVGYGNGVNLAFKHVKTKYFLAFGPDIDGINLEDLQKDQIYQKVG